MILQTLYIIAIVSESITGTLAAGRHKMDLFGVLLIALVTAIGGGTIRDIVLNMHPMTWVKHPEYVLMLCFCSMLTTKIPYFFASLSRLFLMLDAIGLIAFSIIGVNKAIEHEFGFIVCVISGVITGISGGIARDILCNKIPLVFQKELYASVSIVACVLYYCLYFYTPLNADVSVILTLIFGFSFRMIAVKFKLSLPVFIYEDSKKDIDKDSKK
ncbi:trimeric intracellular cation channel family protein [Helicobacter saguini]|uniref:Trimeric intracellular cation channel family protein n=1 Tax=Helicobacter saguini TaxID=1548018 RepID=A0A347VMY7_9HELI|nr:trimeric intracellular cation channel family protein [Helicobacter saguini]MWV61973.1 trimeric intracellular cation channel family protein [Helicobacter saguini]MWV67352.1 trimeric intracellular cation channel family protein [Helicobacter saguini]MWV69705.1 trimeric intracellular cation channel family protein [Helicobacter saguini]MWV73078.1 trimeric intracellular cation channel family protein [Helicobacter saguini]TLD95551.1 trimeric intracellular cation channel family protein [Helicobacte